MPWMPYETLARKWHATGSWARGRGDEKVGACMEQEGMLNGQDLLPSREVLRETNTSLAIFGMPECETSLSMLHADMPCLSVGCIRNTFLFLFKTYISRSGWDSVEG